MKAVLLVTVGVILIFLGLSGGDDAENVAHAVGPAEADVARPEIQLARQDLVQEEPSAEESGFFDEGSAVAEPPPVQPALDLLESPDAGAPAEQELSPPAAEQVPSHKSLGVPPRQVDEPQPAGRVFELMTVGGDPRVLAETLLESWVARDPAPIEDHLNSDEGKKLPLDQRDLVGAFWLALLGQVEGAEAEYERLSGSEAVTSAQLELLGAAVGLSAGGVVPSNTGRRDALARSMRMVLLEESARIAALEGRHPDAARDLSELIQAELDAPWPPHRADLYAWAEALRASQMFYRLDKRGAWPALAYKVLPNESLEGIRKELLLVHPGLRICTGLIQRVNGLGKYIHPGNELRIPTDVPNMLVDLDARLALYRHGSEVVLAWRVGVGREGHATPIGTFEVGLKQKEPAWHRTGHEPLAFGHPDNLLGTRWLGWYQDGDRTSFGFHGTNDPDGVGGQVSAGCIRMRNEDVEELFELLPLDSKVVVQP